MVVGGHRQQFDGTRILDGHGDDELEPVALVSGGRTSRAVPLSNGLPLLHRILDQGSPLIESGLLDSDGFKATVTELEDGLYSEDPAGLTFSASIPPRTRSLSWN